MTKDLFIKYMKAIQKQCEYDKKVARHLSKAFPDAHATDMLPNNNFLKNALIEILVNETKDLGGWIEYFLWELDFGKEDDRLGAYEADGTKIPLSTPDQLWDYLQTLKTKA